MQQTPAKRRRLSAKAAPATSMEASGSSPASAPAAEPAPSELPEQEELQLCHQCEGAGAAKEELQCHRCHYQIHGDDYVQCGRGGTPRCGDCNRAGANLYNAGVGMTNFAPLSKAEVALFFQGCKGKTGTQLVTYAKEILEKIQSTIRDTGAVKS